MESYLSPILAAHRAEAADDPRPVDALIEFAHATATPRPFAAALVTSGFGIAVIAEVKRRSPSKGDLAIDLVPGVLAQAYADGGARAISVLTDRRYFGGSPEDLWEARTATELPILRKDFTVSDADVCDARIMGADAVLLIVAALDDAELKAFAALAAELDLDALVEVHDEAEAERALAAGATLIGVNQRDLRSFAVDANRAERVGRSLPEGIVRVAESGVRDADDAARLSDAGFHAVLVGESLVTSADPAAAVRRLRGAAPCS